MANTIQIMSIGHGTGFNLDAAEKQAQLSSNFNAIVQIPPNPCPGKSFPSSIKRTPIGQPQFSYTQVTFPIFHGITETMYSATCKQKWNVTIACYVPPFPKILKKKTSGRPTPGPDPFKTQR